MDITKLSITDTRKRIQSGELSPEDVIAAYQKNVEEKNDTLNAYLTVLDKPSLDTSKKDAPLFGIPFSMKDAYLTKGVRTTSGSKILDDYVPQYDATVYTKLKEAGAVLLGKTNCDPFGHGSSTENSDYGPSRNPWNLDHVPGGSSGGEGVTVAGRLSGFGIGEDTGGSIRTPASFCSVVGLKVTYGRVSRYGTIAYASSCDTVGPLTRTVEDCALVMETIAGHDPFDANTWHKKPPRYTDSLKKDIRGLKIGLPKEYFGEGIDPEVKEKIMEAVRVLEKLGATVKEVSLPMTQHAVGVYYLIATSETSSNLARYDGIRYGYPRTAFGPEQKRRVMLGTFALAAGYYDAYYIQATKVRTMIKQDFERILDEVDVIIGPVTPTLPFKLGEKNEDPISMYMADILTVSVNLAGIPSLAVPAGLSKEGLPVGMQIMGRHFAEDQLLNIGYQYEQELGGFPQID